MITEHIEKLTKKAKGLCKALSYICMFKFLLFLFYFFIWKVEIIRRVKHVDQNIVHTHKPSSLFMNKTNTVQQEHTAVHKNTSKKVTIHQIIPF